MFQKEKRVKLLCLLLSAVLLCSAGLALPGMSLGAAAAGTPTSIGLAEHGMKAYREGWQYASGGKGGVGPSGVRESDCAGLIYAYFSDLGIDGCMGGATSQVQINCAFSGTISEGIPRIHGLVLTSPDFYSPESGIYGHIGIYIGNGEEVDNSDYGVNMLWEKVDNGRSWNAWHVFDNGVKYPISGWYAMDGKMYHYSNYQYDINTTVDGYTLGSDGIAKDSDGKVIPVDTSMKNEGFGSASKVVERLKSLGYSGKDDTYDRIYGGISNEPDDPNYNGVVTGSGVNLRSAATTKSTVLDVLYRGSKLNITDETEGETVTAHGETSSLWYAVTTPGGTSGYISALFVKKNETALKQPAIAVDKGYVVLSTETSGAEIYYTTDGTSPTEKSTPYTSPLFLTGYTFRAIAVKNGQKSPITTATVLSDGSIFTDFTANDWYFNAVDKAVNYGIFRGNGNTIFAPEKNITRAQFVQALANLNGVDLSLYDHSSGFEDVKAGSTFEKAISWAVETGVVKGYSDTLFLPNQKITREQMCQILANYGGLTPKEDSAPFADDSRISGWAKNAVYACRDNGLINGVGGNRFNPLGSATRAQACVVTVNFYNM